jgi:hypothetical protein
LKCHPDNQIGITQKKDNQIGITQKKDNQIGFAHNFQIPIQLCFGIGPPSPFLPTVADIQTEHH